MQRNIKIFNAKENKHKKKKIPTIHVSISIGKYLGTPLARGSLRG